MSRTVSLPTFNLLILCVCAKDNNVPDSCCGLCLAAAAVVADLTNKHLLIQEVEKRYLVSSRELPFLFIQRRWHRLQRFRNEHY